MKRMKHDETLDRLSELHDSLIYLILSLLPMRDVVRTTLVSKRWKNLWLTLPCLNFTEHNKTSVDSRNFIYRALMLWKGNDIQKLRFSFRNSFCASLFSDMDMWVYFAKERNVEELHIHIPFANRKPAESYQPPQCLYSCSSLKKLSLVACDLQIRGNMNWHQLNTLRLHGFGFTEDTIAQVVSSCPRLETFVLRLFGTHSNLTFRSTSLKTLSMFTSSYSPSVLTVSAPNLETLEISGAPYCECLLMDTSSVTDLTLDFSDFWIEVLGKTLRQILPAFHRLESVTLSPCCYKILAVMKGLFQPMMDVKLLRFFSGPIIPNGVVGLLEIFPKVSRLVIHWKRDADHTLLLESQMQEQGVGKELNFDAEKCVPGVVMQLKIVDITWPFCEDSIFQLVELLLKHATMIEKVVIQKRRNGVTKSEDMLVAAQKLLSLQRSFPDVEIVIDKK